MQTELAPKKSSSTSLVDVLDRVLDKGLVVAGDIKVSVAEVELLTIRIRLVICSIDKAEQIGLDWWRRDPYLSGPVDKLLEQGEGSSAVAAPGLAELAEENRVLKERLLALEAGAARAPDAIEAAPRARAKKARASAAAPRKKKKPASSKRGRE